MTDTAIVVGGGIIGSAVSRSLAEDGWQVSLYDGGPLFGGTSSKAAGLLGFEAEARELGYPIWLDEARDMWEPWVRSWEDVALLPSGFGRIGILWPLISPEDFEAARLGLVGRNRPVDLLSADDLPWGHRYQREVAGGLWLRNDARVDPGLLGAVVQRALPRLGIEVHVGDTVSSVVVEGGRAVGIDSASGRHQADIVVVACGFHTPDLLRQLGWSFQIAPVRGQVLALESPDWWPSYTIQTEDFYAIPRTDGSLVVGSTWEEDVWDATATLEGILDVGQRLRQAFPALSVAPVRGAWAGLRPVSGDDMPYIGPITGVGGLMVAAGHGHHGLMLAPWTGMLVQQMARGVHRSAWTPYDPGRAPRL